MPFNHLPRRILPTAAERREIGDALHLRAQLMPGDPDKLVACAATKASWGGAVLYALGVALQDNPGFVAIGVGAWLVIGAMSIRDLF